LASSDRAKGLAEYADKRAFEQTPEPPPAPAAERSGPLLFVVQQHAARRLHYDFRLELDGVLKSWAIPKGLLIQPGEKHLAIWTEDHPLEYGSFEGVIPPKQYGAGQVIVWDCGIYSPDAEGEFSFADRDRAEQRVRKEIEQGKLSIFLAGEKLKGSYALIRTGMEPNSWLLIRHKDRWAGLPPDDPRVERSVLSGLQVEEIAPTVLRKPLAALAPTGSPERFPGKIGVMLAQSADAPFTDPDWLYEPKLDGYRVLAFIEAGAVTLRSRNGLDLTKAFPVIAQELGEQPVQPMILDGELIAFEGGRPSFNALQNRARLSTPAELTAAEARTPCVFYCFDLLHVAGVNVRHSAYEDRRRFLAQCLAPREHVRLVHAESDGLALYRASIDAGFEGMMAKKKASTYEPGLRTPAWLKVKAVQSAEFVIGGYTKGAGKRQAAFGSLLLGYWDEGQLRYAGNVGTGFDEATLAALRADLEKRRIQAAPFASPPKLAGTTWVKPDRAAEIQFSNWTPDGHLFHPVFLRLRPDVDPRTVTRREDRVAAPGGDAADPMQIAAVLGQLDTRAAKRLITVGEHRISLTHLDKVLWPGHKKLPPVTKGDLLRYLAAVSPWMLPHMANRPVTLIRMPDGIGGEAFYQKRLDQELPPFVETVDVFSEHSGRNQRCLLCNNLATLLWLGQLGTLEFHVWHASTRGAPEDAAGVPFTDSLENVERSALNRPTYVVFDIDPYIYSGKEAPGDEPELNRPAFEKGKQVAFWLKEVLDALSLRSYLKTSGKTGLHVFVPIERTLTFDQARKVCELIGRHVLRQHPESITMEWSVAKRPGKIFIDHNMNVRGKTLNVAYSPRGVPGAPISMPLEWAELQEAYPLDFRIGTVEQRLARDGDEWRDLPSMRQSLERAVRLAP
jgi:bifunctional non-homologous end joining protein LigD